MTAFDFGALQEALLDTSSAIDSPIDRDGIFDRMGKILLVERKIDRLQSAPDTMALIRHILRRETLRSGSPAFLRVPRRSGWRRPRSSCCGWRGPGSGCGRHPGRGGRCAGRG